MGEKPRPVCAHCGATLPAGAAECGVRPDLRLSRRVFVVWEEDGEELRASYPEQCVELADCAVDDELAVRTARAH